MSEQRATTRCTRCGRALQSSESIARHAGPTCWRKIQAAAKVTNITAYKATQIQKAADLLVAGGVARRGTLFSVVSSNKTVHYLTNPIAQTCTCLAGQHGRRCFHLLAATVLAAA